jgi:SAM-dependent methyltransferase
LSAGGWTSLRLGTTTRKVIARTGLSWRIWELDAELRYRPVAEALPALSGPICEVGSGPAGLASWTDREVIGIDPGDDLRHGALESPPNLRRVRADGSSIPLEDGSVAAAAAVDMLEHVPQGAREAVVREMLRVTAPGGKVVIIGPMGKAAAAADCRLVARLRERGIQGGWTIWLDEHRQNGLPEVDEIVGYLGSPRVARVTARGVFDLRLWWFMHLVAMGALPRFGPVHAIALAPFAAAARSFHRGECYRTLVEADVR